MGNPVRSILTGGPGADVSQGGPLSAGIDTDAVTADQGYDSDGPVAKVESTSAEAVIPPRSNCKERRELDRHLDKERNLAERLIDRIKRYCRVANRCDKTARNYLALVHVVSIMVLLL